VSLRSQHELECTRKKLEELEELYSATLKDQTQSERVREVSLQSLRRTINGMKEEIARFEAHAGSTTSDN
jgi:ferritin-like metal-binding protein YciE